MAETKKNPDYSESAINLCNPEEIGVKLAKLHQTQEQIRQLEETLQGNDTYKEYLKVGKMIADITAQIKDMVEAQGSYQDIEAGSYAVKYKRISKVFHTEPFKEHYPKFVSAVVVETINAKALEGIIKGGLIEEADLKMHKVITEDFGYAFYVR